MNTTIKFNGDFGVFKPGDKIIFTDAMGIMHQKTVKKVESSNTLWVEVNRLVEAANLLRNRFYDKSPDIIIKARELIDRESIIRIRRNQ